MKTDLSSPVATAEFSKFAGILSLEIGYFIGSSELQVGRWQEIRNQRTVSCPANLNTT